MKRHTGSVHAWEAQSDKFSPNFHLTGTDKQRLVHTLIRSTRRQVFRSEAWLGDIDTNFCSGWISGCHFIVQTNFFYIIRTISMTSGQGHGKVSNFIYPDLYFLCPTFNNGFDEKSKNLCSGSGRNKLKTLSHPRLGRLISKKFSVCHIHGLAPYFNISIGDYLILQSCTKASIWGYFCLVLQTSQLTNLCTQFPDISLTTVDGFQTFLRN